MLLLAQPRSETAQAPGLPLKDPPQLVYLYVADDLI
jgi:hypothetical protein